VSFAMGRPLFYAPHNLKEKTNPLLSFKIYLLQPQYNSCIVESYKNVVIPTSSLHYTGCSHALLELSYSVFLPEMSNRDTVQ